jgi:putative DNA primase/helicase
MTLTKKDSLSVVLDDAAQQHDANVVLDAPDALDFSENAVARRFAHWARDKVAFDHSQCCWLIWSGPVWVIDSTAAVTEKTRCWIEVERKRAVSPSDFDAMGRVRFINNVERISRADPNLSVDQGCWDRDTCLLGTPGGVVDTRTGLMREGKPEDRITRRTSVAPAPPGTPAPAWEKFLSEATGGDTELAQFLQRWIGYCATGDVSEEVLAFLYGDGGNGKGVFINAVSAALGSYALSMAIETFTTNARSPPEYYRAQMSGARLVMASEPESGCSWAENQIKELTGNEAPVSARHPHGRPFNYRSQAKLQFAGNHAPSLKGRSPAMERRLRVIPFTNKPAEPDLGLKERIREELPAVLRWIIDGCLSWRKQNLGTAAVISEASERYFGQQDTFGRWLAEHCDLSGTMQTRPSDLFADYRVWCQINGETALTSAEFAEARDRTKGLRRKTVDGTRWIAGIGLRRPTDNRWPQ